MSGALALKDPPPCVGTGPPQDRQARLTIRGRAALAPRGPTKAVMPRQREWSLSVRYLRTVARVTSLDESRLSTSAPLQERLRANVQHTPQSRQHSGLGFQARVIQTF